MHAASCSKVAASVAAIACRTHRSRHVLFLSTAIASARAQSNEERRTLATLQLRQGDRSPFDGLRMSGEKPLQRAIPAQAESRTVWSGGPMNRPSIAGFGGMHVRPGNEVPGLSRSKSAEADCASY